MQSDSLLHASFVVSTPQQSAFRSPNATCRLIPISVLRVWNLAASIRSDSYLFDYATTEILTQIEIGFALAASTLPCLRPYLLLAESGSFDLYLVETCWSGFDSEKSLIKGREPKSAGSARLPSSNDRIQLRPPDDRYTITEMLANDTHET